MGHCGDSHCLVCVCVCRSLQIKANAVGWDHVVIATAFMNLGTLEMHRKNYAKAEEWTRKAIAVYQVSVSGILLKPANKIHWSGTEQT